MNQRVGNTPPTQKHLNIASSVQSAFETTLQHIVKSAVEKYPRIDSLVLTGGCALNVTANGKLLSLKTIKKITLPPAPHDGGCCIGACLNSIKVRPNLDSLKTPYLGRNYSANDILTELLNFVKEKPIKYKEEDLIGNAAKLLSEGFLLAWFQGGSEFGPRALGARSFLADPRKDNIRDEINSKIKKRELFRPFAPSVLIEVAKEYFDLKQKSPYMNIVSNVITDEIPAVTHIDNTARVHTVDKKSNPRYYKLIKKFGEITGVPVLLNTSFNIQEPIVYSPKDALETFTKSKVDALVMGDFLVYRSQLKKLNAIKC